MLPEVLKEAIEAEDKRFKRLAVLLLDDDDGITEEAYKALLDVLPEAVALELNKLVDSVDGRFYLPAGQLQDWK